MTYFKDLADIQSSWRMWLEAFRKEVYPVFESFGISFENAVMLYRMNFLMNELTPDNDDEDNKDETLYR